MKNKNLFKKLNRFVQFFVLMLIMATSANSQTLMYYWNFNQSVPATGVNWTAPILDTIHSATLTYTMANAVSFGGSAYNGVTGEVNGGSFCPTGGTANINNGTYIQLNIPTTGYNDISVSYASRRTSSGFTSQVVEYTTNGTDWVVKETKDISTYTNNWVLTQVVTIDFTSIPAVNNNANFAVRVTFNGATTEAGNNRIENIKVLGSAPSTPYAVNFGVTGSNGTLGAQVDGVDIATGDLVQSGKNVVFTAVPAIGYRVKEWKLNTVAVAGNTTNSLTITNLQEISTVSVEFELAPSYLVTFGVVGTNGTLAATVDAVAITTGVSVLGGKDIVFTATPDALYQVKEWKLNTAVVAGNTTNTYTISGLSEISTVSVEFELIPAATGSLIISQYIETSVGSTPKAIELWNKTGAAIDFSTTNLIIKQGSNGGVPAVATTINTGTLADNAILVVGTADVQATTEANGATFSLFTFVFNGDDALEIWLGTVKQDVFGTPGTDPGLAWTGNGVSTANQNISLKPGITTPSLMGWSDPSIRFDSVSTNNSLTGFGLAPAIPVYHAVSFSVAGSNGTISASVNSVSITSGDNVVEGRNIVFTAAPTAGYRVKEWKLNTVAVVGNTTNTFTITNITAASVVTVEFEAIPTYTVNFSVVGANGTISAMVDGVAIATGDIVAAGKNVIFTAVPATNYRVKEWKLNTVVVAGNTSNTDTLLNIQAISTVTVEFEMIPTYAVTFSVVGANGTLAATVDASAITSGASILGGKDIVFAATPATGYQVKEWKLNTVVVTGNTTNAYTIASLSEISTVSVEFELIPTYTVTFTVKNSAAVNITDAVVTFNGVANAAGNYVFTNVAAGSYAYSVVAPGYLALNSTNISVTADATVPVVLLDLPAPATLPIYYSGPWQNSLPTGWSQTGLGTDYTNAAAKFDATGAVLTVNFDSSPDSVIYTIKANASGVWAGTFDVQESIDGVSWTSIASYGSTNVVSSTASIARFKLLSTSRWARWNYTAKTNGNISIDEVYITKEPTLNSVIYSVVGTNGTVSATVDGSPIASGALVQEGKDVVFTAVPNSGFKVKEWINNTVVVTGVTTNLYTLTNLVAPATVSVEFEALPTYTVDFSVVGTNGTLTAMVDGVAITTGALVQEGKNVVFTAVPNTTFIVKEWRVNSAVVTGNTTNSYTLSNISAASTVNVEFKLDVTEINNAKKVLVNIYPNPSTGLYNVTSDNSYNVDVIDILGKTVYSQTIQNGQTTLNLSSFNNGIYFVRFTNAIESFVVKIKKIN